MAPAPHESSEATPQPTCCSCGETMTLVKTHPKVSSFPELRTFRCEQCQSTKTVEA
jgi:transposase-like protein